LFLGLIGSSVAIFGFAPEVNQIDAGHPELAISLVLIIGLSFVMTSLTWLRKERDAPYSYEKLPALTMFVLGFFGIIGGMVVFRPWGFEGLAGGLHGLTMVVFVLVGSGFGIFGWRWYNQRELRYPLAILTGCLTLGLFYFAHQRMNLNIDIPVLALLVIVVFLIPIAVVLYGLKP
jgi:hypothetical protein